MKANNAKRKSTEPELEITTIKLGPEDTRILKAQAAKHAEGNLSAWLRHSGRKYQPKPGERIRQKPS